MRDTAKEKITVSLDHDLVDAVDQEVRAHHADSRSEIVEEALRLWRVEQQRSAIEQGIANYYRSRSHKEQREDRSWTRLAGQYTQRLWDD